MVDFDAVLAAEDSSLSSTPDPATSMGEGALAPANPLSLEPLKAALSKYEPQIGALLARAEAVDIQDADGLEEAVAVGGEIKSLFNAIEKRRKEMKAPALEFGRAVDRVAKMYTGRLKAAEGDLKRKMAVFRQMQEQERRRRERERQQALEAAQKRADEEAAAKGFEPVTIEAAPEPEPEKTVRTEKGAATFRGVWTFKVVDPAQVPREYLCVDEKKIRQAVKAGVREIPGVDIFEDVQVRLGG